MRVTAPDGWSQSRVPRNRGAVAMSPAAPAATQGIGSSQRKYATLVAIARRIGVATPEDEFPVWPPGGEIVARFNPTIEPEDPQIIQAIEANLPS